MTVLQTDPVKKLQSFAENNQQTQGKFTIGDEKVSKGLCLRILAALLTILAIQRVYESRCKSKEAGY